MSFVDMVYFRIRRRSSVGMLSKWHLLPTLGELSPGLAISSFGEDRDIGDLSGNVCGVEGSVQSMSVYCLLGRYTYSYGCFEGI